jgi:hypothetical protein
MKISARSILLAGVSTVTAGAVAIAPSVQPTSSPRPEPASAVQLTAKSVKLADRSQLADWLATAQRVSNPAGVDARVAAEQPAPTAGLLAFPGLGNAIIGLYNVIEPWVAYGVDLADWALGWIPFGWILGDQINIFYDSLEPAVQSLVYNIGWWIGGSISFLDGLNNVILDGANAFIGLLNAEIRYGFGFLPPLPFPPPQIPNLPWFGLLQTQTPSASVDALGEETGAKPGGLLRSLIGNGVAGLDDVLGLRSQSAAIPDELDEQSTVSTVPSIVEDSALGAVTKTVRNVRDEIRENLGNLADRKPTLGGNGVVRAQGEVRGPVGKAVTDAVDALRGGKPNKDTGEASRPSSVAKSLGDTARKVVKDVRQAAKDARDAAKNRGADAEE